MLRAARNAHHLNSFAISSWRFREEKTRKVARAGQSALLALAQGCRDKSDLLKEFPRCVENPMGSVGESTGNRRNAASEPRAVRIAQQPGSGSPGASLQRCGPGRAPGCRT